MRRTRNGTGGAGAALKAYLAAVAAAAPLFYSLRAIDAEGCQLAGDGLALDTHEQYILLMDSRPRLKFRPSFPDRLEGFLTWIELTQIRSL